MYWELEKDGCESEFTVGSFENRICACYEVESLKGKGMSTCVTPACMYGTETLALTELQQPRLQVCESNWVRKIARVTRADMRRRDGSAEELDRETGEEQITVG